MANICIHRFAGEDIQNAVLAGGLSFSDPNLLKVWQVWWWERLQTWSSSLTEPSLPVISIISIIDHLMLSTRKRCGDALHHRIQDG